MVQATKQMKFNAQKQIERNDNKRFVENRYRQQEINKQKQMAKINIENYK